jgi:hypothetical protein
MSIFEDYYFFENKDSIGNDIDFLESLDIDILKSKAICVAEGVFFLQNLKKYITSEKLGLYPEFTYPQLKGMSIITNVQIIEYC